MPQTHTKLKRTVLASNANSVFVLIHNQITSLGVLMQLRTAPICLFKMLLRAKPHNNISVNNIIINQVSETEPSHFKSFTQATIFLDCFSDDDRFTHIVQVNVHGTFKPNFSVLCVAMQNIKQSFNHFPTLNKRLLAFTTSSTLSRLTSSKRCLTSYLIRKCYMHYVLSQFC